MKKKKFLIPIIFFTAIIIVFIIMLNQSSRYNKLIVNESIWNSIKASRTESNNLILTDIKFNDYKVIIDEKNDTLYYSLINDSNNKYNPNVSYSTNSKNVKIVILSDEITDEKVKSNYQFNIMIYNEKEYHIYNLRCTNLPMLNISYNGNEEINQKNISMEMYLFDNLTNIPNKITISSGKIKRDGTNYVFSLNKLTPGKNKRDNKLSILNMKPNSEYTLTKVDDLQFNEENQKIESRKHRVELFINNEYKGVYTVGTIEERVENTTN